MPSFNQAVYAIVKQILKGKVLSYGTIAKMLGNPWCSRAVGYAVATTNAPQAHYHRVAYKDGKLSPAFMLGPENRQYSLLKQEGITFTKDGHVNMAKHLWKPTRNN